MQSGKKSWAEKRMAMRWYWAFVMSVIHQLEFPPTSICKQRHGQVGQRWGNDEVLGMGGKEW